MTVFSDCCQPRSSQQNFPGGCTRLPRNKLATISVKQCTGHWRTVPDSSVILVVGLDCSLRPPCVLLRIMRTCALFLAPAHCDNKQYARSLYPHDGKSSLNTTTLCSCTQRAHHASNVKYSVNNSTKLAGDVRGRAPRGEGRGERGSCWLVWSSVATANSTNSTNTTGVFFPVQNHVRRLSAEIRRPA